MVKTISMECPYCAQTCELHLSSNAAIVILNCPDCKATLMHYENTSIPLSQSQVEVIKTFDGSPSVLKVLRDIMVENHQPAAQKLPLPTKQHTVSLRSEPQRATYKQMLPRKRKRCISGDDILDLQIELGLCRDVGEFVETM